MEKEVIEKMWGYLDKRRRFHESEEAARAANKKYEEMELLEKIKLDLELLLNEFHMDSYERRSFSSKILERNSPTRRGLEQIINKINKIYVCTDAVSVTVIR